MRVWTCAGGSRFVAWDEIASVNAVSARDYVLALRRKGQSKWRSIGVVSSDDNGFDPTLATVAVHCQKLGIPVDGPSMDELRTAIAMYVSSGDSHAGAPPFADVPPTSLIPILVLPAMGNVLAFVAALALAPPDERLVIALLILGFMAVCTTGIAWSIRNQALSGTITRDAVTVRLLFRGRVAIPWVDVTRVQKGSRFVTIHRRNGQPLAVRLDDAPARELVLQQIAARSIPTD